jgi:hypothetical protein
MPHIVHYSRLAAVRSSHGSQSTLEVVEVAHDPLSADPRVPSSARRTSYWADDHLAKNPNGYRCHANTGVRFPETA